MTRLYDYWRSSASYRVRMALNLLGEGFDAIPVDLLQAEQVGAANMARNPQGLVPTVEIDGLTLTQSLAIIEYLNDTRGGLLPADAAGRARVVRFLLRWRWRFTRSATCGLVAMSKPPRLGRSPWPVGRKSSLVMGWRRLRAC